MKDPNVKVPGGIEIMNKMLKLGDDYGINLGPSGKIEGDVIQNNLNGSKGKEIKIGGTVTGNVHKFNSGCSDGKINVIGKGNVKGKFKTTQREPCKS